MKTAAIIVLVLGVIASVIWGITFISAGIKLDSQRDGAGLTTELLGIGVAVGFSFVSWLAAMGVYGLEQIVDHLSFLASRPAEKETPAERRRVRDTGENRERYAQNAPQWTECPHCGALNDTNHSDTCFSCEKPLR